MNRTFRAHSLPQRQRLASRTTSVSRQRNNFLVTPQTESQWIEMGHYRASRSQMLGRGFCSKVYKATHTQTRTIVINIDQQYALKVIDLTRIKSNAQKRFLKNQLKALNKLKNTPHIIHLHQTIRTPTHLAIVTDLCRTSLAQVLKKNHGRRQPLEVEEALKIFQQIVLGYMAMRAQGLVHRDIKSANVLLGKDGEVRICDLGFATEDGQIYEDRTINVGSPLYMAPEVIKSNQYSAKADIWALGLVLLEMLIGDFPWSNVSFNQLRATILNVNFQALLPRELQTKWKVMLLHCLQFDPRRRCGTLELIRYIKPDYQDSDIPSPMHRQSLSTIMPGNAKIRQTITTINTISTDPEQLTYKKRPHLSNPVSRVRMNDSQHRIENKIEGRNIILNGQGRGLKSYSSRRLTTQHMKNDQLVNMKLGHPDSITEQIRKQQMSTLHLARLTFKLVELLDKTSDNIHCNYLQINNTTVNNLISSIFELFDDIRQTRCNHPSNQVIAFHKSKEYEKLIKITQQYSKNYLEYFKVKKHTINFQDLQEEPLSQQLKAHLGKAKGHFQLIFQEIQYARLPEITDQELCEFVALGDYLSTMVQLLRLKSRNPVMFTKTNRIEDTLKKQVCKLSIQEIRRIAKKLQE